MREQHALAVEVMRAAVIAGAGDFRDADFGAAGEEEVDLLDFVLLSGLFDVEFEVAGDEGVGGVGC